MTEETLNQTEATEGSGAASELSGLVSVPMRPTMSVCVNHEDYQGRLIVWQKARILQLEDALNDLLNDCINFDGGKLTDCIMEKASRALKAH